MAERIFRIVITPDEEGWFVAECLDLPGCVSQGKSEREALRNVQDAIGGYLAVELALAGVDVTVIARGEHLAAIRRQGLTLLTGGVEKTARVACTDDSRTAGPQQYVILAVKAHAVAAIAEGVASLLLSLIHI